MADELTNCIRNDISHALMHDGICTLRNANSKIGLFFFFENCLVPSFKCNALIHTFADDDDNNLLCDALCKLMTAYVHL